MILAGETLDTQGDLAISQRPRLAPAYAETGWLSNGGCHADDDSHANEDARNLRAGFPVWYSV